MKLSGRTLGVIVIVAGVGVTGWAWYTALTRGYFSMFFTIMGPLAVSLGVGLIIENPPLTEDRMTGTPTTRTAMVIGAIASAINLLLLKNC